MAHAPRIIRGTIGTGLTFAVDTGAATTLIALLLIGPVGARPRTSGWWASSPSSPSCSASASRAC
jgi:hypothetical protein